MYEGRDMAGSRGLWRGLCDLALSIFFEKGSPFDRRSCAVLSHDLCCILHRFTARRRKLYTLSLPPSQRSKSRAFEANLDDIPSLPWNISFANTLFPHSANLLRHLAGQLVRIERSSDAYPRVGKEAYNSDLQRTIIPSPTSSFGYQLMRLQDSSSSPVRSSQSMIIRTRDDPFSPLQPQRNANRIPYRLEIVLTLETCIWETCVHLAITNERMMMMTGSGERSKCDPQSLCCTLERLRRNNNSSFHTLLKNLSMLSANDLSNTYRAFSLRQWHTDP